MRKTEQSMRWVIYRMTMHGKPSGRNAVCEQGEWETMERAKPGYHTLVLAGITNEGEAERLARSGTGDGDTNQPVELNLPVESHSRQSETICQEEVDP